jgi:hypothetical protein
MVGEGPLGWVGALRGGVGWLYGSIELFGLVDRAVAIQDFGPRRNLDLTDMFYKIANPDPLYEEYGRLTTAKLSTRGVAQSARGR